MGNNCYLDHLSLILVSVRFPSASQAKTSAVAIPEHQWDSLMESGLILPIAVSEFKLGFYLVSMFSSFYVLRFSVLSGHGFILLKQILFPVVLV